MCLLRCRLYRIDVGKEVYYALDESEKNGILERLAAENKRAKPSVQRFKGLGDESPQLRETTMHPDTRAWCSWSSTRRRHRQRLICCWRKSVPATARRGSRQRISPTSLADVKQCPVLLSGNYINQELTPHTNGINRQALHARDQVAVLEPDATLNSPEPDVLAQRLGLRSRSVGPAGPGTSTLLPDSSTFHQHF